MSDKIADKDIKNDVGFRIKKMMEIVVDFDNCKNFQCKAIDKIFDLEKDLKTYKRIANMNLKDSEEFNKNICEHRCPIKSDYEEVKQDSETWKKIAERLAILLFKGLEGRHICDVIKKEHCNKYTSDKCIQCIIDWTKNEVLKK